MAVGKNFDGLVGGVMSQQLRAPIEEISFARVKFGGVLERADSLQRVGIGGTAGAKRGGGFRQSLGRAQNRIGAMAAALGGIGYARYDELGLIEIRGTGVGGRGLGPAGR